MAIIDLTATEIAEHIKTGVITARAVTEATLARMDSVNPVLNAVVARNDAEALKAADAVDAARARGDTLGPMAGVPVTTKENVDQAGFATTNGLRLQKDLIAHSDNPVVANLRRAGAVSVRVTARPSGVWVQVQAKGWLSA